jgi:hypothetical protein
MIKSSYLSSNFYFMGIEKSPIEESSTFSIEQVKNEEQGILERYSGKARKVAKVLMAVTALATAGFAANAHAETRDAYPSFDKGSMTHEMEQGMDNDARALEFLSKLARVHAPEDRPLSPAQQILTQKRTAQIMIQQFAGELALQMTEDPTTTRGSVNVGPDEMKYALDLLNKMSGNYADEAYGNSDGTVSPEEVSVGFSQMRSNPAFQALQEMQVQYSQ